MSQISKDLINADPPVAFTFTPTLSVRVGYIRVVKQDLSLANTSIMDLSTNMCRRNISSSAMLKGGSVSADASFGADPTPPIWTSFNRLSLSLVLELVVSIDSWLTDQSYITELTSSPLGEDKTFIWIESAFLRSTSMRISV